MLNTAHIDEEIMDATLPLQPAVQRGKVMAKHTHKRKHESLSLQPDSPGEEELGDEDDEQEEEVVDAADDNEDHEHKSDNEEAKQPAKKYKRVFWPGQTWMELTDALREYTVHNNGKLPASIKTTKAATVPQAWKDIAKKCSVTKDLDPNIGGRACSLKWSNLRSSLKVRQANTSAHHLFCLLTFAPFVHLCRTALRPSMRSGVILS